MRAYTYCCYYQVGYCNTYIKMRILEGSKQDLNTSIKFRKKTKTTMNLIYIYFSCLFLSSFGATATETIW